MGATNQSDDIDPDKLVSPDNDSNEDSTEKLDPDPGESAAGRIIGGNLGLGSHGMLEVVDADGHTKELWLNGRLAGQLVASLEGTVVGVEKGTEEKTFTTEDGDERSYHDRDLLVEGDSDE